jgi:hypothetical protein
MTSKAKQLSSNGHKTNGELAQRNLAVQVAQLQEMRWMLTNALEAGDPALLAFDDGASKLATALACLVARTTA